MNPEVKPFSSTVPDSAHVLQEQASLTVSISTQHVKSKSHADDTPQQKDELKNDRPRQKDEPHAILKEPNECDISTSAIKQLDDTEQCHSTPHTTAASSLNSIEEPLTKRLRHDDRTQENGIKLSDNDSDSVNEQRSKSYDSQPTVVTRSASLKLNATDKVQHPHEDAAIPDDTPTLPLALQRRLHPPPSSIGIPLLDEAFPSSIQEVKKDGPPNELVSPKRKLVTPNNGELEVGLQFYTPHLYEQEHTNTMLPSDNNNVRRGSGHRVDNNSASRTGASL